MADPFYTCCEDGMLSQVPPSDRSGLCPACKPPEKPWPFTGCSGPLTVADQEEHDSPTDGVKACAITAMQFKLIDAKNALQHAADSASPEVAEVYRQRALEVAEVVSALAHGVPEAPALAGLAEYLRRAANGVIANCDRSGVGPREQQAAEKLRGWASEVDRIACVTPCDGGKNG